MKKLFYLLAFLMLSLTFVVSCSKDSDKKDEPEAPPPPPPPAPTAADSLQGTWYGYYGEIHGTSPGTPLYPDFLPIFNYDTLTFSGTAVTQKWWIPTPTTNWPHKILNGTFAVSTGVLTNSITSQTKWTVPGDIPENPAIYENHAYKMYFATNLTKTPYTKDTLTLIMTYGTEITTNGFGPAMGVNAGTASINNPILTLKFKRKP